MKKWVRFAGWIKREDCRQIKLSAKWGRLLGRWRGQCEKMVSSKFQQGRKVGTSLLQQKQSCRLTDRYFFSAA
jgi:hypothetical protein